jgi:putative metallohydrolase (TIGR04338 family)
VATPIFGCTKLKETMIMTPAQIQDLEDHRDFQKTRVYGAEEFWQSEWMLEPEYQGYGQYFKALGEVEGFVSEILNSRYVLAEHSPPVVRLIGDPEDGWNHDQAAFVRGLDEIHVPLDSAGRPVVVSGFTILHEIAHLLCESTFGPGEFHGEGFTRVHVELIRAVIGGDEADLLLWAYANADVLVDPDTSWPPLEELLSEK